MSRSEQQTLCLYAPAEECRNCHHKGKADHQAGCIAGTAATTAHAAVCAAVHIRQTIVTAVLLVVEALLVLQVKAMLGILHRGVSWLFPSRI